MTVTTSSGAGCAIRKDAPADINVAHNEPAAALTPRQPTPAMMRAGIDKSLTFKTLAPMYSTEILALWQAMWDASITRAKLGMELHDGTQPLPTRLSFEDEP